MLLEVRGRVVRRRQRRPRRRRTTRRGSQDTTICRGEAEGGLPHSSRCNLGIWWGREVGVC